MGLDLNGVDYAIIAIMALSVLAGFARGIVKELLSLLTWIIAFFAASMFSSKLAGSFTENSTMKSIVTDASSSSGMDMSDPMSMLSLGLSFVSIFLVILVLGALITYVISAAVDRVGLGFVNRIFGGFFGLLRGLLINIVFIFIIELTTYDEEAWWKASVLVPHFQPTVTWLSTLVYPNFDKIKEKMHQSMSKTADSLIENIYQYRG